MRSRNISTVVLSLVTMAAGAVLAAPAASAATDSMAPSVPRNLHSSGQFRANDVLSWDASTDDSGSIYHYWVLVDGQQRLRPVAPTFDVQTLVNLCRITKGQHKITVLAVDRALNRSAQSSAVEVTVS